MWVREAGHLNGRSSLGAVSEPTQDEVGHDNELGAGDGPVEIERDLPAHGVACDFYNPSRAGVDREASAVAMFGVTLAFASPPAPRIDAAGMTVTPSLV